MAKVYHLTYFNSMVHNIIIVVSTITQGTQMSNCRQLPPESSMERIFSRHGVPETLVSDMDLSTHLESFKTLTNSAT